MKKGQSPGYTESTHVSPCSSRKEGRKEGKRWEGKRKEDKEEKNRGN